MDVLPIADDAFAPMSVLTGRASLLDTGNLSVVDNFIPLAHLCMQRVRNYVSYPRPTMSSQLTRLCLQDLCQTVLQVVVSKVSALLRSYTQGVCICITQAPYQSLTMCLRLPVSAHRMCVSTSNRSLCG